MSNAHLPVAANLQHIEALAEAIMDGQATIKAQSLAAALHLDYHVIKRASAVGHLPVVRVSPRRIVVTREGLVAYLARLNEFSTELPR